MNKKNKCNLFSCFTVFYDITLSDASRPLYEQCNFTVSFLKPIPAAKFSKSFARRYYVLVCRQPFFPL